MWKEVPSDVKIQYKQKAAIAQEQFKRDHPNYTYRKARRKRALNELLARSGQGFQMPAFATDPNFQAMLNPYFMQMYSQGQAPFGPGMPESQNQGAPNAPRQ
jgi:transcription factor SOX7/8/10/18 (SOX group E/F)